MSLGALTLLLAQNAAPMSPADVQAPPTGDATEPTAPAATPPAPPSPTRVPGAALPVVSSSPPLPVVTPLATPPPGLTPPPEAEEATASGRARRRDRSTSMKAGVSAHYQRIFDVPIYGGGIQFGIGPRRRSHTLFVAFDLEHGFTEKGLSTWGGRLMFAPEWGSNRLRVGFGVGAGFFEMARVTNTAQMSSFTLLSGELHASVDLVDTSDADAFFLALSLHGDLHFPVLWGPTASLGFRTDDL